MFNYTYNIMIAVKDILVDEAKYDIKFLQRMTDIGIECPTLGRELSFKIVGKNGVPVSTVANVIRTGMNDTLNVLCLDVDTGVDVSKSNITTNSPYVINQIFVNNVLRMIPIRQVANRRFHISVKNDSDKYALITSKDIKSSDKGDSKSSKDMFYQDYHIAKLPPHTFLDVQNIMTTDGFGYSDGIGHSYALRIGYKCITLNEYELTTTPTTVIDPSQVVIQVCWMYVSMLTAFKKVVDIAGDKYEYVDNVYSVSSDGNVVIYKINNCSQSVGAVIEEFGQMIDSSPETWITYNILHNTINAIEIKVRHADVKKYISHILSAVIDIFQHISDTFALIAK